MVMNESDPQDGYCTQCGSELLADLCPSPGCFGLPMTLLDQYGRDELVQGETLEAAKSLIPYLSGQEGKFDYLSLRYSGFSLKEAVQMAKVTDRQLQEWRALDAKFRYLESQLAGEFRKDIRKEISSLVFLRNYHMALRKDAQIFHKALVADDSDEQMTDHDHRYLLEARKHYTAQQMAVVEGVVGVGQEAKGEFEELMIRVRKYKGGGVQEIIDGSNN